MKYSWTLRTERWNCSAGIFLWEFLKRNTSTPRLLCRSNCWWNMPSLQSNQHPSDTSCMTLSLDQNGYDYVIWQQPLFQHEFTILQLLLVLQLSLYDVALLVQLIKKKHYHQGCFIFFELCCGKKILLQSYFFYIFNTVIKNHSRKCSSGSLEMEF